MADLCAAIGLSHTHPPGDCSNLAFPAGPLDRCASAMAAGVMVNNEVSSEIKRVVLRALIFIVFNLVNKLGYP